MKNWIIGIGVTLLTAALGVGAAYGGSKLMETAGADRRAAFPAENFDNFMMFRQRELPRESFRQAAPGSSPNTRFGRMGQRGVSPDAEPIVMEEAIRQAEVFAAQISSDLKLAEVMEFEHNYYAVFVEKEGGRGGVEILVDRYGRGAGYEPGPAMMWNLKYGPPMHRIEGTAAENNVSVDEARAAAQEYLDVHLAGATLEADGYAFYGYYTFDYSVDGDIAGMLSVNGLTGRVWLHTWHGAFIAEEEMVK